MQLLKEEHEWICSICGKKAFIQQWHELKSSQHHRSAIGCKTMSQRLTHNAALGVQMSYMLRVTSACRSVVISDFVTLFLPCRAPHLKSNKGIAGCLHSVDFQTMELLWWLRNTQSSFVPVAILTSECPMSVCGVGKMNAIHLSNRTHEAFCNLMRC